MAVTPTGVPAWVRSNDHTAYGGNVNKVNYQSIGAVNPRTDFTAENLCRMAADLAAVARTAAFANITLTCNDTVPLAPTINAYSAMAGDAPTVARLSNGSITITWLSTYSDPYSVAGTLNIVGAIAAAHVVGSSDVCFPSIAILSATQIRVDIYDDTGTAVTDGKVSLSVWTG